MGEKRDRILIDSEVQVDLLWQATKYWFFCLLTIALFMFCWTILTADNLGSAAILHTLMHQFGPAAATSVLVLPLIYFDLLRVSQRFAGPIFKLRQTLQAIAAGEKVSPLQFRDDDYWHELAADFNAALAKVQADAAASRDISDDDTVVLNWSDLGEDSPLLTAPPDLIDFPALLPEGERKSLEAVAS